jgi:hypothetical protein
MSYFRLFGDGDLPNDGGHPISGVPCIAEEVLALLGRERFAEHGDHPVGDSVFA